MRNWIIALGLTISATVATADAAKADIAWQVDRFAAGARMVMQDRTGTFTHIKRGTENGLHVFDTYAGRRALDTFLGSYKTNARGEVVETVAFDGAKTRFVPHRCSRTLGTCQFTVVHPDGFTEPRTRVTERTRNGLRYQEFGLDGLMTEGVLKLDALGASEGGWQKRFPEGEGKTRTRRVDLALN